MLTLLRLIKSVRLVGLYLYIFINAFDTVPHFSSPILTSVPPS